ncbi:hypothetical protein PAMP_006755 [Pampus punctatissimus]
MALVLIFFTHQNLHEHCLTECCSPQLQSGKRVVVASAQPANSTKVILAAPAVKAALITRITHRCLSACATAAHTKASRIMLITDTQSHLAIVGLMHSQSKQPDAPSCCLPRSATVVASCSIRHHFSPETCLPQPQSVMLTGVLHSLSSWHRMLHETKQP